MPSYAYKPVMLMILDGWGIREMEHGNAIALGNTPNYDRWQRTRERAILGASEEAVGLVPDQMGNSEVGHLNLGAGRIVYQDISRINNAVQDGSFYQIPLLVETFQRAKQQGKKVHLIGLLGSGGVHAHHTHQFALLKVAHQQGVTPVIHVITDGRDTPPDSGKGFIQELQAKVEEYGGVIASVSGRYYAMDRDKRWERTRKAYDAIVHRQGESAETPLQAVLQSYEKGVTDEFIPPTVLGDPKAPLKIEAGDSVICFNFRADRMRQMVRLWTEDALQKELGIVPIPDLEIITFTEYDPAYPVKILFPVEIVTNPLAEVLSKAGKQQFHIAETEKYPHVTFFFNGRREAPFSGEARTIVPSPKVATYDLKPEMSAYEVTETLLERLHTHDDDFILINFANPDMVGHTGVLEAAIKAVETVDECAGRLVEAVLAKGGVAIVTADHGNCDRMIDEVTGEPHTYHTTAAVPLFVIAQEYFGVRPRGVLADVAPTVLELMGIPQPPEMTGRSLIHFEL
jgi:2,3-bisphosphoglycerate-independent phosphoglycerate mutase